jgi:hypothetical protein
MRAWPSARGCAGLVTVPTSQLAAVAVLVADRGRGDVGRHHRAGGGGAASVFGIRRPIEEMLDAGRRRWSPSPTGEHFTWRTGLPSQ